MHVLYAYLDCLRDWLQQCVQRCYEVKIISNEQNYSDGCEWSNKHARQGGMWAEIVLNALRIIGETKPSKAIERAKFLS